MQYNKITKENIDHLLFEVAKEYHKHEKKAKGEIVIVGGAAIPFAKRGTYLFCVEGRACT